jgi:hypothetical protein
MRMGSAAVVPSPLRESTGKTMPVFGNSFPSSWNVPMGLCLT